MLKRQKALDLYEGGARVEANAAYLVRHPFETEKQYNIRLTRATYRNFAAPIVDVFTSSICDKRPARTLPAELEPLLVDVDGRNGNANVFFTNAARLAAAGGSSFVLVDMEPAKGLTLAENERAGRRNVPYFAAIDADDVYDWDYDDYGVSWAVIHSLEAVGRRPFEMPQVRDILTVWTRHDWVKLAGTPHPAGQTMGTGALDAMVETGKGAHFLGQVPLVPFLFEPVTPMTGNPATDDVLSLILRVYRRDSELDKMLFDCAVPLAILTGLDQDLLKDFVRASSNVLVSEQQGGITGQYLEPNGQSYKALREETDADISSIREIALRMVRPQSAVGESAESKNIDREQLNTQLAAFARRCANSERQCWELAYKWLNNGHGTNPDAIATPYNEDYSISLEERLDKKYLLEMQRAGMISAQSFLELLREMGVLPEGFDIAREINRLEMEMKGASGPTGLDEAARKLRAAI